VAELERRLEDLTSRIEHAQSQKQAPSPPASESDRSARLPIWEDVGPKKQTRPFAHIFPDGPLFESSAEEPVSQDLTPPSDEHLSGSSPLLPATVVNSLPLPNANIVLNPVPRGDIRSWPDVAESQRFLSDYLRFYERLCPIVAIPRDLTAEQLREQRPFLWKAVMVHQCSSEAPRQEVLARQLFEEISAAAITGAPSPMTSSRNLDLLQGLQVLFAWVNYGLNSFQVTNVVFLIRSIFVNLGIPDMLRNSFTAEGNYSSTTLEHMRALVATYYITTM
jgi:hypothetical protein